MLSALRAEWAFFFLKILSVSFSADSQRKRRVMAVRRKETPLFDTISTECSLSLLFAAEPDDYQAAFILAAQSLNYSHTPPHSVSTQYSETQRS